MRRTPTGSSLIAELESALTLLDVAEHGFVPETKEIHISNARKSCSLVQNWIETAVLSLAERTAISIELSVLQMRLTASAQSRPLKHPVFTN